jgi:protein TonB
MAQKISHLTPRGGETLAAPPSATANPAHESLEATLPPTPLKRLLAADGAAVYVLSSDSGLVDAITTAGGEQFPIQQVPTLKALRSLVDTGQCKIALLDAEPFGSAVRARIAELKAIDPELVVLVAAPRDVAEELMGLFSERVIHRLLIKPLAIGMTRLMLESAVSRFLQIRDSHDETVTEAVVPTRRARAEYTQPSRSAWFLAIALVSVLVAGVLIGGFMRGGFGGADAPTTATADRFAAPTDAPETPASSIAGSSIATTTATDSSPVSSLAESGDTVSTATIPEQPPSAEGEAESPLSAEVNRGVAQVIDEAAAGLVAGAVVAASGESAPADGETSAVVDEPEPRRAALAAVAASAPSEIDSLLAIARTRVQRGQLLAPAGDSARDYVERALSLEADNSEALALRAEVGAAMADSARIVLESGEIERAGALASEARRFGAPTETLALLEVDLAAARAAAAERAATVEREQQQLLATGIERMQQGRLIAPENDSALFHLQQLRAQNANYPGFEAAWRDLGVRLTRQVTAAIEAKDWTAAEAWIASLASVAEPAAVDSLRGDLAAAHLQEEYLARPARAGELRVVTVGAVSYPEDAQRRGIDGWVEAEFIVGANGVPRDARVVEAMPRGWFEDAALTTIARYRYEPFERDGRVYERLARLRIRFNLQ